MSSKTESTGKIWGIVDNLRGDKVVWIIALSLLLLSVVFLFSSSSRLLGAGESRLDIVGGQIKMVFFALLIIVAIYNIRKIEWFRKISAWGFALSLLLLIFLQTPGIGPVRPMKINGAVRCILIGHFQFHVFEVVKVAMVMYMSWAVDKLKTGSFEVLDRIAGAENMGFLGTELAKKLIFIYFPFAIATVLVMTGSNSSAVFIAGILLITVVIGGGDWKDLLILIALVSGMLLTCVGLYSLTKHNPHPVFERVGTAISRLKDKDWETVYIIQDERVRTTRGSERADAVQARQKAIDNLRQPYGAKIAIHQGGLHGKGPGRSTQRYVVPDMSEDYMFSFILEEYGIVGAIVIMGLYLSLLARATIIVKNCGKNLFAKTAIAGLTLLITGQAFLHICVNADIGPMTGQTLPLLSHGNSALFCFSVAFGVILSISRIARDGVEKETMQSEPLRSFQQRESENVRSTLDELDMMESGNYGEDKGDY